MEKYKENFNQWIEEDLNFIRNESIWKLCKKKEGNFQVFASSERGESSCALIKVEGDIEGDLADAEDLLHHHLLERQHEWQKEFLDGKILESSEDRREEVCLMAYKTGSALVQTRDCVYVKIFRKLDEGGFICCYRSVEHAEGGPRKGRTRLEILRASHVCVDLGEGKYRLTSMQQATPGGWVPIVLSNKVQPGIIMHECLTIEKVTQKK